jgi:hypothetical protein
MCAAADQPPRIGGRLRACCGAGPTDYVLYWQLTALNVHGDVVAPTLVPVKPGDRAKTDWRRALKLARFMRQGLRAQPALRCEVAPDGS